MPPSGRPATRSFGEHIKLKKEGDTSLDTEATLDWSEYFWNNEFKINDVHSPITLENLDSYTTPHLLCFQSIFLTLLSNNYSIWTKYQLDL